MTVSRSNAQGVHRRRNAAPPRVVATQASPLEVAPAWRPFYLALADVLAALEDGQRIVIGHHRRPVYIEALAQGAQGMHLEAGIIADSEGPKRLGRPQLDRLRELGWNRATGSPARVGNASQGPERSSNFFREWDVPVPVADVAAFAVATLREVCGATQPRYLDYVAFGPGGYRILLPTLGLQWSRNDPPNPATQHNSSIYYPEGPDDLRDTLKVFLRNITGLKNLEPDEDGDFGFRHRTTHLWVQVSTYQPVIHLVSEVPFPGPRSPELDAILGAFNTETPLIKVWHANDNVRAQIDLIASPLCPSHLETALPYLANQTRELEAALEPLLAVGSPINGSRPRQRCRAASALN